MTVTFSPFGDFSSSKTCLLDTIFLCLILLSGTCGPFAFDRVSSLIT